MKFNVEINNLGKLQHATVSINRFTVFAGANNSGKSFTSKILYSIFNALRANHAEASLSMLIEPVVDIIDLMYFRRRFHKSDTHESTLQEEFEKLTSLVENCPSRNSDELKIFISNFINQIDVVQSRFNEIRNEFADSDRLSDLANDLANSLNELKESLQDVDEAELISNGMKLELGRNILGNFQAVTLSQLSEKEMYPFSIKIENVGEFKFLDYFLEEEISLELEEAWHEHALRFSSLIYLESPIYWKLKTPLEDFQFSHRRLWTRRRPLVGIPQHFYDLCRFLKYEYTGDFDFPNIYQKLVKDFGGKLTISKDGDLSFHEDSNDRKIPITQTATGIANIGFLSLLIQRKLLDKKSFIFIDEPEAHLHPQWQVLMAECLFELAHSGVHVVIATHSVEFLEWLEVRIKKNPDDVNLVALNNFSQSVVNSSDDFENNLAEIKKNLTDPYAELYIEGL